MELSQSIASLPGYIRIERGRQPSNELEIPMRNFLKSSTTYKAEGTFDEVKNNEGGHRETL